MRLFYTCCIVFLLFTTTGWSQEDTVSYDSLLADSLGADEYGMRTYTFVILTSGDNTDQDSLKRQAAFAGHLRNIRRLSHKGEIIVAGPFGKNKKEYRGLFIFKNPNFQEVKQLLLTDPAIKNDYLSYELFSWYGSAALPLYLDKHKRIQKKGF